MRGEREREEEEENKTRAGGPRERETRKTGATVQLFNLLSRSISGAYRGPAVYATDCRLFSQNLSPLSLFSCIRAMCACSLAIPTLFGQLVGHMICRVHLELAHTNSRGAHAISICRCCCMPSLSLCNVLCPVCAISLSPSLHPS